ncbi:MAG TPA: PIN domain-containing protein [Thermoflexia bacterium]|nr:PIN domain-containing protein [Thermoflexia bacterium]
MRPRVFLDTSALIAGLVSPGRASNLILSLAEAEVITLVISEEVLIEPDCNLRARLPRAIPEYRRFLAACPIEKADPPDAAEVAAAAEIIHLKDAPILAAAMALRVDYLVTLDRRHFLDDPEVARRSGLRIGTPGDFLAWLRSQLER